MERIEETPLVQAARELKRRLAGLQAPGRASYLYNPLEYAFSNHAEYLVRFGKPPKQVIFLGMNPGPFGMAQTGIPFGDVRTVADWLRIDHPVGKPEREHPKRPIRGLGCSRVEVSGQRLWGAIRAHFGTPERFFQRFFVANYCPALLCRRLWAQLHARQVACCRP
jgi:single-strand selective monofunctional uracil DNA glycosylase